MVATAPVPSASTFAKDSLSAGSVKRPLDPTQIAPEVLTAGSNAAANPPSMGSSAFGRAMRLETITSLIGYLPVQARVVTFQAGLGSGADARFAEDSGCVGVPLPATVGRISPRNWPFGCALSQRTLARN